MIPRVLKTITLARTPDRHALHELACQHAEEQFKLHGECPPTWIIAMDSNVGWIETAWESDNEKGRSVNVIRGMLDAMQAQAYTFITEAWIGAMDADKMTKAEMDHWSKIANEQGVRSLPEHMRDDALLVFSHDRSGGMSYAKYLVNIRPRGPNYLGIRIDEAMGEGKWEGRMMNLFDPEREEVLEQ